MTPTVLGPLHAPTQAAVPRAGSDNYATLMLDIYVEVVMSGLPNVMVAHVVIPANLHLEEWDTLVALAKDTQVIDFQKFMFPIGYEGLIRTSASVLITHQHSIAAEMFTPTSAPMCESGPY